MGEKTGKNPTDRAKSGTKRSLLTDGDGVPLLVVVADTNVHDKKLVSATLNGMVVLRPDPRRKVKQHLCSDKGFDYEDVRRLLDCWGYTAHILSRGEESFCCRNVPGYLVRRRVVERTHSWMNRFRRLLIRWEKKSAKYCYATCCMCMDYIQSWRSFRIGSKFWTSSFRCM